MSFFDLFKSRESREKLSHLRNLVAVAFADGKFQKSEAAAIATVMAREGLTPADLERCIKNPKSIDFVPPTSETKRLDCLRDMVILMMCDGHIDDKEIAVCKTTAIALGYKHEIVEALVLTTIAEVKAQLEIR